ncbi:hypothetical protein VP01_2986g7 [Puccinia sorghi]|uniref:Arf-GAP domain-containing protein n=1 Tax=Puccinia sorghi TaxID=27349 RepID=A0A0L6V0M2_9BASI|nr:hypothetical protein VP01_2986g7 [Puccinia sorghi]
MTTTRATAERHQQMLLELLKQPSNQLCADCQSRNPRWASWSLGIFICLKCAAIHRKLGTHITKVKSVTMDSWTKDQVQIHNSEGNPLPTDLEESERDSQLEKYIRNKYASKRSIQPRPINGPSMSPTSSLFKQSSPQLVQPTSGAGASRLAEIPAHPQRPTVARTVTSHASPAIRTTAKQEDIRSVSLPSHAPQPPLRPSTAPIPSDGYHGSHPTPSLPSVPSIYNMHLNQPVVQPGYLQPSQPFQPQLPRNSEPPPRTDGVWGDLMQLAEPSLNHGQPPAGFQVPPNTYVQPLHSTAHPANTSYDLDASMGRLMSHSSQPAPANHLLSTNPFSSQSFAAQNLSTALFQGSAQPQSQSTFPSSVHPPQQQPTNLFFNQYAAAPAPFANQHMHAAPNRNPFLPASSQQALPPVTQPSGSYYSPSHQQRSASFSINPHAPFFQ